MKKTLKIAAALCLLGSTGHAAWSGDDLIMAFKKNAASDVYIDLGSATTRLANGFSLDLTAAGVSTVLSSTYGSDWYSSGLVAWTVFSTSGNSMTSFTTRSNLDLLNNNTYEEAVQNFQQNGGVNLVGLAATGGTAVQSSFTQGGDTYYTSVASNTDQNGFTVNDLGTALWSSAFLHPLAATYGDGTKNLYTISSVNGAQTTAGAITTSGGVISAVPEPSTYALMGFGALLLIIAYRRKANA